METAKRCPLRLRCERCGAFNPSHSRRPICPPCRRADPAGAEREHDERDA